MISVSVIIPVYNAEKYINECITSLLSQTLTSCEFIFVNDGSQDKSQSIIETFQKKDNRIVLINQENQGVSVARNSGIAIAQGEYIGFVDADDYVESNLYEKLIDSSQQCDVVASNFITYQDGRILISKAVFLPNKVYDKAYIQNQIIPFCIKTDDLNSSCNKIFKRELIFENKLLFPKGVAHGEDAQFNLKAFNVAKSVIFIEYAGYHYREVEGSASRNAVEKDYFQKAIETYAIDYKTTFNLSLGLAEIEKLKAVRFIHTVMALIHIYFKSTNINVSKRYSIVKKMIHSDILQKALHENWDTVIANKNKYSRFILHSIRSKSVFRLFLAATYSNYKN